MKPSSLSPSPSPSPPPPSRHATPPGHRSPTPLPPLPAHILAAQEVRRRNALRERGPCRSGCGDLDSHVLRGGGFERGCVVGVSAEEEGVGMALGLQVLSRELLDRPDSRALIITPRPAAEVLRSLRESLVAQQRQQQQQTGGGCSLGHCLERVMLSCVFDMDGLWEVLSDLSDAEADAEPDDSHKEGQRHEMQRQTQTKGKGKEIQDSQDEEETLSTPLDDTATTNNNNNDTTNTTTTITTNTTPSFILITHFSTLLSGLFAQRERQAAHSTVSLLSARLNYLSRNLPPNPLIMILNSVTESPGTTPARPHQTRTRTRTRNGIQADAKPTKTKLTPSTALDSSLQSIFSAPPPLDILGYHYTGNLPRRLKPSFGLVFTQLLDLHLLCSQVARTRAHDALPGLQDREGDAGGVVTVVEVLMDEMGVWQGRRGVRPRREQRWTAVDVVKGRVCCAM
ncbi:hypothetical protein E4U56_000189 [Claviceps arundinis]|uniref:Uncharacterized protein n=1 Tax=Claviceps arundinis TaxID=1623583 RepID=A0A9P7MYW9_9HYPO|nr:hypothetical protein E4U56_000189 [Claviceps arundinis]